MVLKLKVSVDQRELDRYLKKLDKNRGLPLQKRTQALTYAASRLFIPTGKREVPVGQGRIIRGALVRPGGMQKKVKVKLLRKQGGEFIRPTWFGSATWYSHFPTGGTVDHPLESTRGKSAFVAFATGDIRPLAGMRSHSDPNPWVERVVGSTYDDVVARVGRDIWDTK